MSAADIFPSRQLTSTEISHDEDRPVQPLLCFYPKAAVGTTMTFRLHHRHNFAEILLLRQAQVQWMHEVLRGYTLPMYRVCRVADSSHSIG